MKKKHFLSILGLLAGATVLSLGVAGFSASATSNVNADNNGWSEVAIEESYAANSELFLPNLEYTRGGKTYAAKPTVYFPDNSAYGKNDLILDQIGHYSVVYNAETPDGVFSKAYSFLVKSGSFSLSSTTSYASYGHDPLAGDITNTKNGMVSKEKDGLYVHLAKDDTLTFNKYIDMTDLTIDDFIYTGYIAPTQHGSADFDEIDFLLTDADDPSVFLKIATKRRFTSDVKVGIANTRIKANNQQYGAINYSTIYQNAGEIYGSGQIIPFHGMASYLYNDEQGNEQYYPFEPLSNAYPFRVSLVSETMEMYNTVNFFTCTHKKGETYWEGGVQKTYEDYDFTPCLTGTERHILTDLDNSKVYGNNLFTGFPSGKAQLSISATGYNAEYASFVITSVLGMDMADFDYVDKDAPKITVDCPYDTLPEGMVGGTYPIFDATAFDEYSKNCDVKAEVYFNIDSDSPIKIAHDGQTVRTDRAGWYSIVYTSSDLNGNTATKILKFHVGGNVDPIAFSDLPDETSPIGELYSVSPCTVTGGSGDIDVSVSATCNTTGETVEVIDGAFRPETLGDWTIAYQASDMVGHASEASYTLTVGPNSNTVLESDPILPKIMISGGSYDVPRVRAFNYDSDGNKTTTTLKAKVFDADGKEADSFTTGGSTFANIEEDEATLTFDFYTGSYDASKVLRKAYVDVIKGLDNDTGDVLLDHYFVSEEFSKERLPVGEKLTSTGSVNDPSFYFANPVQAIDFGIKLQNVAGGNDYSSLNVTLEDSADPTLKATLTVKIDGSGATIANGKQSSFVRGSYANDSFDVDYAEGYFSIDSANVAIANYDNGESFEGFPSNKVYVTITLCDASASSSIYVRKINNHDFSYEESSKDLTDFVAPQIFLFGVYGGHYGLNEDYDTNVAFASDVICPNVDATVTVRDPDSKKLVNEEDATESNSITLNSYGEYRVTYTASDASDNNVKKSFTINVTDDVAPTITFADAMVESAKVGDNIAIPSWSVADDVSATENIAKKLYVIYPDGHKVTIPEGTSYFRPSYAGKYFFHFVATDEAGNVTILEKVVTVE